MGLSLGCMISAMYDSPNGGDIMLRGPNNPMWTMTDVGGQQLSLHELKNSIKVPLDEREAFAIARSWKTISQNLANVGSDILLRMFEERPDVTAMFERLRSVDKADLGALSALEIHAVIVMDAVDDVIVNMDDPEYVIDTLLATGKTHKRFENFSTAVFWAIEEPFITGVKRALVDSYSPTIDLMYRKSIKFILATLATGFMYNFPDDGSVITS